MIGSKKRQYRYRWRCPVCHHNCKRPMESRSLCERYGRLHIKKEHEGADVRPQIIEVKVKDPSVVQKYPENKTVIPLPDNDSTWFEIFEVPSFNVKPADKLLLPHHIFVKEKIYKKIQKRHGKKALETSKTIIVGHKK